MCKYQIEYFDYEGNKLGYSCPHPAINNEGYCIFHDPNYWETHEDEVRRAFYDLVKDAINNNKPLYCIGFHLPSFNINHLTYEGLDKIEFRKPVYFSYAKFHAIANFSKAIFQTKADFSEVIFEDEVDFKWTLFPKFVNNNEILITFRHTTFRKRVRFIGGSDVERNKLEKEINKILESLKIRKKQLELSRDPSIKLIEEHQRALENYLKSDLKLDLSGVSFVGVDLSNVEFHNVKWNEKRELFFKRYIIADEYLMRKQSNYEEVSRVYNELRKNYESELLFNEASHFFIGEMEAIRLKLRNSKSWTDKAKSFLYLVYKWIAMYGESVSLPLIWTIAVISGFTILRALTGTCSLEICNEDVCPIKSCNLNDYLIDSIAAYFQFPRSDPMNNFDIIERAISIPILGTAFIALRRIFERRK